MLSTRTVPVRRKLFLSLEFVAIATAISTHSLSLARSHGRVPPQPASPAHHLREHTRRRHRVAVEGMDIDRPFE